ncbi:MAG TPA: GH3 auxin-responsive promoter family protein, partial [Saprospiraceae bacterium]|nr:GH3 auxin-responsive promoter family protein [Saprospiraceae bacterium]
MGIKAILASATASFIGRSVARKRSNPILDQAQIFLKLIKKAADTRFGHDHDFASITKYSDFVERVPLREYEEFSTYIALIKQGESDILWPGKPKYLAKTSGTTSGIKYIPLTKESMPSHFNTARDAAFNYIYKTGNTAFFDGKLLYLSGSPELDNTGPIPTGRLSGISNHEVPAIFRRSQLPSYTVNCIEDWEEKVDAIISESLDEDIRMISGIPSWVKMYIERVLQKTGKQKLMEVYPNLSLY